jgi:hypothetical protein
MNGKSRLVLARTSKAVVAIAIVGLYMPLVSTGSASATDPAPTMFGSKITVDSLPPVAGKTVGFTALLFSGTDPVTGEPAQLWIRPAGKSAFTQVAEVTTDARGTVHAAVVLTHNSHTHWVFSGDSQYGPSQTEDILQRVATRIRARVSDRMLTTGERLVVRGKTFPAKPGHTVSLWVGNKPVPRLAEAHTLLAEAVVRADGTYRIAHRFSTDGKRKLFVRVSRGDGNAAGYSPYRYVRVG